MQETGSAVAAHRRLPGKRWGWTREHRWLGCIDGIRCLPPRGSQRSPRIRAHGPRMRVSPWECKRSLTSCSSLPRLSIRLAGSHPVMGRAWRAPGLSPPQSKPSRSVVAATWPGPYL